MKKSKIFICSILFLVVFSHLTYSKDSLIIDTKDYRLFYVGKTVSTNLLKSKFVAFTKFVNVPIDTSFYKLEYPNPFSPPNIDQKFIYQLSDESNVQINLLDTQDSILLSLNLEDQIAGYYYFIFKTKYFDKHSLSIKIQSSFENYRIKFVIKDEEYVFPLNVRSN